MKHSLRYYSIVDALIRRLGSRLPASAQEEVRMLAELHVEDDISEERRFNSRLALMTDPEIARYVHNAVAMVLTELAYSGLHVEDPDSFRAWWCEAYTIRYQDVRGQIGVNPFDRTRRKVNFRPRVCKRLQTQQEVSNRG